MSSVSLSDLSETAQILLGAFAMADVHTLSVEHVVSLSNGVISAAAAQAALAELSAGGLAEATTGTAEGGYRLTRTGMELTLQMQQALARRESRGGAGHNPE